MRRDGLLGAAVRADDPDLEVAGRLMRERDLRSVRTPRRLEVIGGPAGDGYRLAAIRRHLPDIAAHRERDPLAVGTPRRIERPRRHRRHHVALFAVAVAVAIRTGGPDHHGEGDEGERGEGELASRG